MSEEKQERVITIREKVVFLLVVFLIKMIKPWEYDHQFTSFWSEIKAQLDRS